MRIAVSNIAWRSADDEAVATLLTGHGVTAIEVAPTMIWPRPLEVEPAQVLAYRDWWERRGIRIVALQALLFGRPDLRLFGAAGEVAETLDYLSGIFRLAALLGAGPLVFGSPKNRVAGALPERELDGLARRFFQSAGASAEAHGVVLGLEPNPREYGCDFITNAAEARALVAAVASPGFALHLDAAAMTLAGDGPDAVGAGFLPVHFHISEPYLAPVGTGGVDHAAFARALHASGYEGWCSIEMRAPEGESPLDAIARALELAVAVYGDPDAATSRRS